MELRAGTSGFAYQGWKGRFYPADLPASRMLDHYGRRLRAVEINNTFYRMPRASVLEGWAGRVPADFRFALKASRRITHQKRLVEVGEEVDYLYGVAEALGERRGPMLFQLPPYLRKDIGRLRAFLDGLPGEHRAVLEFRHPSWFDDEVYDALRDFGAGLCLADSDDGAAPPRVETTSVGYLRLRREHYTPEDLESWLSTLRGSGWGEAYVFFKHEEAGEAAELAARLQALHDARTPRRAQAPGSSAREGAA